MNIAIYVSLHAPSYMLRATSLLGIFPGSSLRFSQHLRIIFIAYLLNAIFAFDFKIV